MRNVAIWMCLCTLLLGLLPSHVGAQSKQQLRAMYDSLLVDTRALDHFKERWAVSDPVVIREVFTQLKRRSSTALAADSVHAILAQVAPFISNGLSDDVRLVCTKRYYDDEIESVAFQVLEKGMPRALGTIRDYVLVLDALGSETYDLLRARRYKDRFENTRGTQYDIYLSPLESRVMVWATSPTVEWWRVYLYGRLGNDYLVLPFWFKSSIVAALELLYIDDVTVNERSYTKFGICAGVEAVNNFSVPAQEDASPNAIFKKRKLQGSGDAFFLRATFTPAKRTNILSSSLEERLEWQLELSFAMNEKTSYASNIPDSFYSVRNSVSLAATLRNVELFHLGAGVAWHDLHRIARYVPEKNAPARIGAVESHLLPFLEFGIARDGSLLQFDISTSLHHDLNSGCGFFGFRSKLLLSNMVGLDMRYFRTYTPSRLPPWQYENYLLPSFILHINL